MSCPDYQVDDVPYFPSHPWAGRKAGQHVPTRIGVRGKSDSFTLKCSCGFESDVGVWYENPPPIWFCADWTALVKAGEALIKSTRLFENPNRLI